ncbi:MAG: nickel pincer cofactor biosynthesis protein LarB [Candidatus Altiarchaeota archaeon]
MKSAKPDFDRARRCGIPEVIYAEGKTLADCTQIAGRHLSESGRAILTRISEKDAKKISAKLSGKDVHSSINPRAKTLVLKKKDFKLEETGCIGILTAGTSDIPVAEEAAEIARELGLNVKTEYDVGVAGIHRVYPALDKLADAQALIVVAGMEGALPSVISGLVDVPVIGIPSSVGYGIGAGGKAALYAMLNSCAPVAVVNIDNGFGAAVIAAQITRRKKWQP